jgi:hypothetical protein
MKLKTELAVGRSLWLALLVLASFRPAFADGVTRWDGYWALSQPGQAKSFIQISRGKVVRCQYEGIFVPIAFQESSSNRLTFGVRGQYRVEIDLVGPTSARASIASRAFGAAIAELSKEQ